MRNQGNLSGSICLVIFESCKTIESPLVPIAYEVTIVPIPASVKISKSNE
jgi:hypothetical protein